MNRVDRKTYVEIAELLKMSIKAIAERMHKSPVEIAANLQKKHLTLVGQVGPTHMYQ